MNLVVITGNLGADPETLFLPSGTQTARLRIAVKDFWYDKNTSQKQEKTHWFTVNAFARQAENCGKYLHKGSKLLVRGSLEYREWTDKEGHKRSSVEIHMQEMEMLDGKPRGEQGQPVEQHGARQSSGSNDGEITPEDDDIPF